jgi:hypothetical protein
MTMEVEGCGGREIEEERTGRQNMGNYGTKATAESQRSGAGRDQAILLEPAN